MNLFLIERYVILLHVIGAVNLLVITRDLDLGLGLHPGAHLQRIAVNGALLSVSARNGRTQPVPRHLYISIQLSLIQSLGEFFPVPGSFCEGHKSLKITICVEIHVAAHALVFLPIGVLSSRLSFLVEGTVAAEA